MPPGNQNGQTPRQRANKRIGDARGREKLRAFDYHQRNEQQGFEEATLCKMSGHVLASLVPHERLRFNNMPLAVRAESPNYAEIEITFDDGSKHVTPICRTAIDFIVVPETLEDIYAADLASWSRTQPEILDKPHIVDRVPVSFRRVR